ncbi:hypothetical protein I3760_06G091400 [Carya illinoinensis]|nr:hypothetical protein I3760_06G091400 [Carya illinoinensis]
MGCVLVCGIRLKLYVGGTQLGHLQVLKAFKENNDVEQNFWPLFPQISTCMNFA